MTLNPQSKVRMFCNDVIRLLEKLTYCWLEFLYYILFKGGINSRVCCCAWVLTLNICASSHSAETIWPSICSLVNSAALLMETNEFPGLCRSGHLGSKTDYLSCHYLCSTLASLKIYSIGPHLWFHVPKCLLLWKYICNWNIETQNWYL